MTDTATNGENTPPDAGGAVDLDEIEIGESHRPALEKLVSDLKELERELLSGFNTRREALIWLQKLAIRTLGQVPDKWYRRMSNAFTGGVRGKERVVLSLLLCEQARVRDLDEAAVQQARSRVSAMTVRPSLHRAVRQLRSDAGEYVDDERGSTSKHDPNKQRYIAMRPALNELEGRQRGVLLRFLDGFDDVQAVVEWTGDVEVATHGEIRDAWTTRVVSEQSTLNTLLSDRDVDERARETVAAYFLLPAFNAGARDLFGRSIESPNADKESKEAPDWE
jgi:hypothetical protein